MTETIEPMTAQIDQQQLAEELVDKARAEGMELVGQGGLLTGLMKSVFETAAETAAVSQVISAGTSVQNLRRGHYELARRQSPASAHNCHHQLTLVL